MDTLQVADELYAAGFSDGRHSRDYDPRGCQEWQDVVDALVAPKQTYAAIAQALNWERTEFNTLDELLEEIREADQANSNFVDLAIHDQELLGKVREKILAADGAGDMAWTFAIQEVGQMLLDSAEQHTASGFAEGGYVKEPPSGQVAAVLRPTHTLLHAGELYREVTILLHTEQLVAWRTADGQEYSAPAHQVLLDPDEDGLAAAILSRIAGVEIAPDHMAELRAQMAGGVK